ncbi:MAG: GntR family transcriptional regulator [Cumulibacter sp.]
MADLLTLPWERLDDSCTIAMRMAAFTARQIVERRFEAGDLLSEGALADSLGVSRTPAREAMLQLESWQLVRLVPKKGAIVTSVTSEQRRDLLAVRALFETNAIATIGQDTATLVADLRVIVEMQRNALAERDILQFASTDYAMHARIIRGGGNSIVDEVLAGLGPRLARLTYQAILDQVGSLEKIFAEHEQLVDLASAGDAAKFDSLVRRHINDVHFGPHGAAR